MSYKIYQFGTMVLPNYNADQDIGLEAPSKYAALPWGGAFDYLGGETARPGGYKLNKPCTLYAETEANLLTNFMALRILVGKRDKLYRLRFADGMMEWTWARLEGIKGVRKSGDKFALNFTLGFYIEPPCWYSTTTHSYTWEDMGSNPDDLTTCHAESDAIATIQIDHSGNIDQPAAIFTITATFGAVTLVTISNPTTGYSFSYNGSLATGKALVIDTGAVSVLNDGADDYDHLAPPTNHEEWMHIAPGLNTLNVTITGGGRLAVAYYAAFA